MAKRLSETPLPSMAGMAAGLAILIQIGGRLLHIPEINVNLGSLTAGLAGLLYGFILWAEAGKHRPSAPGKK